jgi:hypothetical protein
LDVPPSSGKVPYTVASVATFLGEVRADGDARESFRAAFDALELMSEGYLTEAQIKGLEMWRFREVIRVTFSRFFRSMKLEGGIQLPPWKPFSDFSPL